MIQSFLRTVFVGLLIFVIFIGSETVFGKTMFDDCLVYDDMAGVNTALLKKTHGQIDTGSTINSAKDANDSFLRGADAKIAVFDKGTIVYSIDSSKWSEAEFTFAARFKISSDCVKANIFLCSGPNEPNLFGITINKNKIESIFRTTGNDTPLNVTMDSNILRRGWHDIVCRIRNGAKFELFVDGKLCDQDFVLGGLGRSLSPITCAIGDSSFKGEIDYVALWGRAITNQETKQLSGGRLQLAFDSVKGESMQYWKPPNNYWVGDCLPYYHNGVYHFIYLLDKNHHQSKNRLGAHQWVQAVSTDLVNWEHKPIMIGIDSQWEGSIGTGSIFYNEKEKKYYAFYLTRKPDRSQLVSYAVSDNCVDFTKLEPNPLIAPSELYEARQFRDPVVFQDPCTGLYNMLVSSSLKTPEFNRLGNGCLALCTSSDMHHWQVATPFIVPGYIGTPECPDYFEWNGWYYLIFSNAGIAQYRISKNPTGPWTRPEVDVLDAAELRVFKTAAYHKNRRIGCGFLRVGTTKKSYAGNAVFREVIQNSDGSLGTKFPEEMIPTHNDAIQITLKALTKNISTDANSVSIDSTQGMSVGLTSNIPHNAYITMRVNPKSNVGFYGLKFRGSDKFGKGYELWFDPAGRRVALGNAQQTAYIFGDLGSTLYSVSGLEKPFDLQIVLKDDICDICINNCRTMVARIEDFKGSELYLFARDAKVSFELIKVYPLKDRVSEKAIATKEGN